MKKPRNLSPLRYPGGKVILARVLEKLIYGNRLKGCTYIEPFAGGAGAGLKLLSDGHVDRVIINDADKAIYAFWKSVTNDSEEFIELIRKTPINLEEWERQRDVYRSPNKYRRINLGFAAFYLNRCNRSGIIMNGGPIGGQSQKGEWKIGARFNKAELSNRVRHISNFRDRISVYRKDARGLIDDIRTNEKREPLFIYADPPYFVKGKGLYLNHFHEDDHAFLAKAINRLKNVSWALTYDDHPQIRKLYSSQRIHSFNLRYSAHQGSTQGGEILITPRHLKVGSDALRHLSDLCPHS